MLSEGNFFSLPHLLETRSDLESSILLAKNLFYRQAFQVLRGYLESVILPIYFYSWPERYREWKVDEFSPPTIRGKQGVLAKSIKAGLIDEDLANKASNLYSQLNGYIHGSAERLNNRGVFDGTWESHVFRESEYSKWANTFSEAIDIGIRLTRLHHMQWTAAVKELGVICRVCHAQDFDISVDNDINDCLQYSCKICKNTFHLDKNGERTVITTIEIIDENSGD